MSRRLLHISDLHFGRDRPELRDPLIAQINEIGPDMVVVSGDFTQRARPSQYRAARAFLDRLEAPILAVPGNHDTPLDNLWVRLARPWTRYRAHISPELEPSYEDEVMSIVGINTVNHWSWQRGRIGRHTVRRACRAFRGQDTPRLNVAVLHHPLEHLPEVEKRLMRGARDALSSLADCDTDVVLSGHLHRWRAVPFQEAGGVLLIQAGTGLSTRLRGEPNDMNLITGEHGAVTIERLVAHAPDTTFRPAETARFEKREGRWHEV